MQPQPGLGRYSHARGIESEAGVPCRTPKSISASLRRTTFIRGECVKPRHMLVSRTPASIDTASGPLVYRASITPNSSPLRTARKPCHTQVPCSGKVPNVFQQTHTLLQHQQPTKQLVVHNCDVMWTLLLGHLESGRAVQHSCRVVAAEAVLAAVCAQPHATVSDGWPQGTVATGTEMWASRGSIHLHRQHAHAGSICSAMARLQG